ncbi:MAG: tRNA lysidine(34) synthetase TilS, partial [Myxococcota bacterium]
MKTLFRVKEFIESNSLIKGSDRILLAVSGGPDSMALLDIMDNLSIIMGFEIGVAHIDHKMRVDSHKDMQFVESECAGRDIPFYGREVYIFGARKSEKRSLEQRAREERYNALLSIADEFGYNLIATGHTLSDQAETLLMRIISGTTIKSLSGILLNRDERIIRPLLILSRTEVMEYIRGHKIKFVEDYTNRDKRYLRNKVRLDLIPYLKKHFNPNIEEALYSLAEDAAQLRMLLNKTLNGYLQKVKYDEDFSIATFEQRDFIDIPMELRRYFLLDIISNLNVSRRIDSDNIRCAIDFLLKARGSSFYRLTSDIVIRCEYGKVSMGHIPHIKQMFSDLMEYKPIVIKSFGRYKLYWLDVEIAFELGRKMRANYPQIFLSLEKFSFPFSIRIFEDGDRIYSGHYKR